MFTGIIQEIGRVRSAVKKSNLLLRVESQVVAPVLKKGDSAAVNGVCQTVIESRKSEFSVEAIGETLARSNLGRLNTGDLVNLEAPMRADGMFHGHFVQGHVDCVGKIVSMEPDAESLRISIEFPKRFGKYLIEKGSVAVDGISLTVVGVRPAAFTVAVIPYTLENTILRYRKSGDQVNLEFDMIARYLEKYIGATDEGILTIGFLEEHGFG